MKRTWNLRMVEARHLTLPRLAIAAAASLALAFGLSACENVATYTQPSLVRVIDASYIAPAVNVTVEGTILAGNIGQGSITPYGTLTASTNASIKVTAATGGKALVTTNGTLLAGHQHSIFLTDNGAAATSYEVTILEDQQVAAAGGHSAFRFLNQAPKTGAVDVYMIPSGTTIANTIPIVTALPVGSTAGYISFTSQTVTMVIVPTGLLTPKYTSSSLALTGGEVRTVLIVDTQLTSNPPVEVFMANDVD
ncbi:MAG: DUF4397 domain-containing protein [Terracidiphilus sp.]|nr:DUF4397 domain-containing protein [Terracidiphilus sp.]